MCVLTILDYTNIWSYAKMLFVIQNFVKSLLRKDEKDRICKRIVVKIKDIALINRLFRKGIKLLSRGKNKLYAFTQNKETSTYLFSDHVPVRIRMTAMLAFVQTSWFSLEEFPNEELLLAFLTR